MQFSRGFAKENAISCFLCSSSYHPVMTSITIKMPEELKERLEDQARLRGKSCSAVVRDSLEKELAASRKPSLLDRIQDLIPKRGSGIPDLATNPKYMKGYGEWRE